MVRLLLESKADPLAYDKEEKAPLDLAVENKHAEVIRILQAHSGRGLADFFGLVCGCISGDLNASQRLKRYKGVSIILLFLSVVFPLGDIATDYWVTAVWLTGEFVYVGIASLCLTLISNFALGVLFFHWDSKFPENAPLGGPILGAVITLLGLRRASCAHD